MTIADVLEGRARWHVEQGDCRDVLRSIPDDSIDAMVTDPPAGIGFMGRKWDSDKGGRDEWILWLTVRMLEAYRVLKPGAHALVWALPRTSHWTGMALENAGFEVRDRIEHIFGSGFPKSLDIGKAIRKVPFTLPDPSMVAALEADAGRGWGTALKPACEDWWLVRKPFRGSVAKNVLALGTGAINVDGCRVPHASAADLEQHAAGVAAIKARGGSMDNSWANHSDLAGASDVTALGRWPSHLLLTHGPGCERVGTRKVKAHTPWAANERPPLFTGGDVSPVHHSDGDGFETVEHWECSEGCPVPMLDEQSGGVDDEGGAARYFATFAPDPFCYAPKADRADREKGCEYLPRKSGGELTGRAEGSAGLDSPRTGAGRGGGRRNHHPTVKSTYLMRWLVRLVTPARGVVLDMFTGSGSTGVACSAEGLRFIGAELDPEYAEIARARIIGDAPLLNAAGGVAL